nr:immunoglobulin heavy chain junction region [Mus musculus]NSM07141.1 immunoglobulin heavy chain junction region [Mus musculus]NSM09487.1 immunoglobulin heavy chain junction region [Mus musculus]
CARTAQARGYAMDYW